MNGPILVVDDEVTNLAVLREVLSGDYRLVFARSGTEALTAVRKHRPSLVLLDVRMPDMDGYEVCRRLKADRSLPDMPVLFVTSLADEHDQARGFECGAVDYIVKPVQPVVVRARVRTHLSLVKAARLESSYRDAVHMLGEAGHYRDSDTGNHVWRMAEYASALAGGLGWDSESCEVIKYAAPLHDTGKLGIPDAILRKPGPLDAEEWVVMRKHPEIGYQILSQSKAPVFTMAAEIALCHHEKWDGSGYPRGLAGTDIPESARVVAVADVFDALSMRRPYKEAMPEGRTLEILRAGAGNHFEARMVEVFFDILPRIRELRDTWEDRVPLAVPG